MQNDRTENKSCVMISTWVTLECWPI